MPRLSVNRKGARRALSAWAFNQRFLALFLKRDHVVCLGDSHVKVMRYVRIPGVWFSVRPLKGATASGVLNPSSKTQSLATFTSRLQRAKRWQPIILQLGEVDCGFVIWHRAARRGLSIDGQLAYTLDSYATFIENVIGMGFERVIILSAPLPTIGDMQSEWGGSVASLRTEVTATKSERTGLTLRFNNGLRERCESIGATFVDVTTGHLDPSTGEIDPRFVRETRRNHHLADEPYARLIAAELSQLWKEPLPRAVPPREHPSRSLRSRA
jgi:hypothetical protein